MGGSWHRLGAQLHRLLWFVLMLQLRVEECAALNPEGFALLEFRARVEDDPYRAFDSWDPQDSDPCSWSGVHCIDGKVEILNLTGLALGGTLGPELAKLRSLKSLVLYKNNFYGAIPKEIGGLSMLELLDLSNNKLSGTIPAEIGEMPSLKHFLLCGNKFQGALSIKGHDSPDEKQCSQSFYPDEANKVDCLNRKAGCRFKINRISSSYEYRGKDGTNFPSFNEHLKRRQLLKEASNLPALSGNNNLSLVLPEPADLPSINVPSLGSGSFPAAPNAKNQPASPVTPADLLPAPAVRPTMPELAQKTDSSMENRPAAIENWRKWAYILVLPGAVLLISIVVGTFLVCRDREPSTIAPWKTGLSGQLQKAFVTGVPKLNRTELEAACEDFSNIIITHPECTVFKGTLSSGVEIAVVSTAVPSVRDWSKRSEMLFRKKIDTLSRINHKNFINLIGYCEEDEPFMRMMVLEYAPNGTLFEHLHIKEFEHLDWGARMRIIMGMAYCLQYIHELNPPIVIPELHSNAIFMTDDYAAKIADLSIWKEVITTKRNPSGDDMNPSEAVSVDPGNIIHSFGILLLEIVSGRLPHSEEQGSLLNWSTENLKDKDNIQNLVDPTLMNYKDGELDAICEVIQDCIHPNPKHRPTMREIATKLRQVSGISPDAATPRLSPLWWAELEILSMEAS